MNPKLVCDIFIFNSSNIGATTNPSRLSIQHWYRLFTTLSAAAFHSTHSGSQWLVMFIFFSRTCTAPKSLWFASMACRRAISIDLIISLLLIEEGVRFDQTSLAAASFHLNNLVGVMSLCREGLTCYHEISPLQCNTPSPMSPGRIPLTIREGNLT